MDRSVCGAGSVAPVLRSFAVRGVVEGFYGTPWTHDARLEVIAFLAGRGMNAYAYAPKDDTRHRAQWRLPYARQELDAFADLAAHSAQHGVRFGYSIAPGLDVDYESPADRSALLGKLESLRDAGIDWFLLLFDDIPLGPGLAPRQGALVSWLHEALGTDVTVCPTEYVGTHPSPYLAQLDNALPPGVDVMWTGPTVCSPHLRAEDARGWARAFGNRRIVVWDNYPVNDALMTGSLHLGPYRGREPELADLVGGILCNPMTQARASQVPLATAMDFLADPDAYDDERSWRRAIDDVGGDRAGPLGVLAHACADSPIATPDTLDLAHRVAALAAQLTGPDWVPAVAELRADLSAACTVSDAFPVSATADDLAAELAPWASAARIEAEAGIAALRLIQASRPVASVGSDGRGRAAAPDPETAMQTAFVVLFAWKGARADENVVFGPRFAIYTPIVQLADGRPALDTHAALREDANAIDSLCRLALRTYDEWRLEAAEPLRVFVGADERKCAPDGSFDAQGGAVTLRQGRVATSAAPGSRLPFSDRRLR
jgi:hyaluronoglucosaminidase